MILFEYLPLLIQGTQTTVCAWVSAGMGTLLLGTFLGIISCNALQLKKLAACIKFFTFVAKGVPAYVQILIAYFIIPPLLNLPLSGFWAATLALIFCSAGYVTEIVRAGINAVPSGQWEACHVLGYSKPTALKRIILPQAFQIFLPSLLGEMEQLLKSTSLLATIGVTEVTRAGMNIISRELNPAPVYLTVACIYLVFSAFLTFLGTSIERKGRYGYRY
jgi:polar amino acid transport system permease protein